MHVKLVTGQLLFDHGTYEHQRCEPGGLYGSTLFYETLVRIAAYHIAHDATSVSFIAIRARTEIVGAAEARKKKMKT